MKISINAYHWTCIGCLIVVGIISTWRWGIVFNTTDQLPHESMVMERFSENYAVHVFQYGQESKVYNYPEAGIDKILGLLPVPYYYAYNLAGLRGLVIVDALLSIATFLIVLLVFQRLVLNRWLCLLASAFYVTRIHVFILENTSSIYRQFAYSTSGVAVLSFLFINCCLLFAIYYTRYLKMNKDNTTLYINLLAGIIMIMSAFYLSYLCFYDDYWRAMRPYASHPFFWATIWGLLLVYDKSSSAPYITGISLALLAQLNPFAFAFLAPIATIFFVVTIIHKCIPLKHWVLAAAISFIIIFPFIYSIINADPNAGRPTFAPIRSDQAWGYLNQKHFLALFVISITILFLNMNKLRDANLCNILLFYALATFIALPFFYYSIGHFIQAWHFNHLNDKSVFLFAEILFILGCIRLVQVKAHNQFIIQRRSLIALSVVLASSMLLYRSAVSQAQSTKYSQDFIKLSKELNKYKGQEYVLGTLHEKVFWLWSAMEGYSLIPGAHARMSVEEIDRRLFYYFDVLELTADQVKQVLDNHNALSGEVIPIYRGADKLPFVKRDTNDLLKKYESAGIVNGEYRVDLLVIDKHVRPLIEQAQLSENWEVVLDTSSYLLLEKND